MPVIYSTRYTVFAHFSQFKLHDQLRMLKQDAEKKDSLISELSSVKFVVV